jgi:hypothetical protein
MTRYHLVSTATGEIVGQYNAKPRLYAERRQTPRTGLHIAKRYITRNERDVVYWASVVVLGATAYSLLAYAFH